MGWSFDSIALCIAAFGLLFSKKEEPAAIIVANLVIYNIIYYFNLDRIFPQAYFLAAVIIAFASINLSLIFKADKFVSIIFLISLLYNGLSFVEFPTEYTYVYDKYTVLMGLLIISLIYNIFKNGALGEYVNRIFNRSCNNSHSIWSGVIQNRGL